MMTQDFVPCCSLSESKAQVVEEATDSTLPVESPRESLVPEVAQPDQATQKLEFVAGAKPILYKIARVDNQKGRGLLATTDISRGQLILSEVPLFRFISLGYNDRLESRREFNKLKRSKQDEVWKLANVRAKERRPEDLEGVLRTNGIELNDPRQQGMYGLFVKASRINHSCLPNTYASWDSTKGTLDFYATRSISRGEEITSTYTANLECYDLRQSHFRSTFGFVCQCCLCALPEEARKASDSRIQEINRRVHQQVWKLGQIRDLLRLYEQESIVDGRPIKAYDDAWCLAKRAGDSQRARIFAERGAQLSAEIEGPNSENAIQWRKRLEQTRRDVMDSEGEGMLEEGEVLEDWLFGDLRPKRNFDGWTDGV